MNARDVLKKAYPVMPVVVIENAQHAVALAQSLLAGGVGSMEITLRTADALKAITEVALHVPQMLVGAGTVLNAKQLQQATDAGAKFAISPGITTAIAALVQSSVIPFIPGIASAGDIMLALEHNIDVMKFFPAENCGGVGLLKSFAGPFSNVLFCPTGGITVQSAPNYLALKNVACVGGSWLTPADLQRKQDWAAITALARASSLLKAGN